VKLEATYLGKNARTQAAAPPPFGPGFPPEIAEKAEKLEVTGTSFNDAGPDYCEFRVFDRQGTLLGLKRVEGY